MIQLLFSVSAFQIFIAAGQHLRTLSEVKSSVKGILQQAQHSNEGWKIAVKDLTPE